jgi:hypothetical protein
LEAQDVAITDTRRGVMVSLAEHLEEVIVVRKLEITP